jgi:hypothetical protein
MITTVRWYDFKDAFDDIRPDNFSYEGLEAHFPCLSAFPFKSFGNSLVNVGFGLRA